jgi:hypothetical protein
MFVKPGMDETIKFIVRQDPDGMVKPILAESQCPSSKSTWPEMVVEIWFPQNVSRYHRLTRGSTRYSLNLRTPMGTERCEPFQGHEKDT